MKLPVFFISQYIIVKYRTAIFFQISCNPMRYKWGVHVILPSCGCQIWSELKRVIKEKRKSTLNGWQAIFDRITGRWAFSKPSQYVSIPALALRQNRWCSGIPSINDKTPSGPLPDWQPLRIWTHSCQWLRRCFTCALLNGDESFSCYVAANTSLSAQKQTEFHSHTLLLHGVT